MFKYQARRAGQLPKVSQAEKGLAATPSEEAGYDLTDRLADGLRLDQCGPGLKQGDRSVGH